jgi:hypothetical protein
MSKLDALARYAAPVEKKKRKKQVTVRIIDEDVADVRRSNEHIEEAWEDTDDAPTIEQAMSGYQRKVIIHDTILMNTTLLFTIYVRVTGKH